MVSERNPFSQNFNNNGDMLGRIEKFPDANQIEWKVYAIDGDDHGTKGNLYKVGNGLGFSD